MLTAPQLFAGVSPNGDRLCFFCGGRCDETYRATDYVLDSFTERNSVIAPGSEYVCGGCVECLRGDVESIQMIDGTSAVPKSDSTRKLQMRWYSWVFSQGYRVAATPSHRELLLSACLNPPEPPFAICIADGNKHQLFRTPLNWSREVYGINCEGSIAVCSPAAIIERMKLTKKIISVVGKGGDAQQQIFDESQDVSTALWLSRSLPDFEQIFTAWRRVRREPLTDLAIWLSPGKEECIRDTTAT